MKATEFLPHFNNVQGVRPNQWKACCPAHDDRNPSLVITEADDRLLIHCRAGCPSRDVLSAVGLDYPNLFLDSHKTQRTNNPSVPRQPERVPHWYWNWRSQCAELERHIQGKRERHEAILAATQGMDINGLTVNEFNELMTYVGTAYEWLNRCERLDEMLFDLQQILRAEEQAQRVKGRKVTA